METSLYRRPILWAGRYPVDLTTLLIATHCLAMIGCALLMAVGAEHVLRLLEFSSVGFSHGQMWRAMTYALVEPPSLWFVVRMLMLYAFGREVERILGAGLMGALYSVLIVVPAVTVWGLGSIFSTPFSLSGSEFCVLGIFIAFATFYPKTELFIAHITVQMTLWILMVLYTLQFLAARELVPGLAFVWATWVLGGLGARAGLIAVSSGWLSYWQGWRQEQRHERQSRARRRQEERKAKALGSLDDLLEKISRKGLNSLSRSERSRLEEARAELLKKTRS